MRHRLRQYLEKVTVDLRKAHGRVRELEQKAQEPIAIVGIACRYPGGVGSAEELWELLAEGRDAVAGFPPDRGWDLERLYDPDPDKPGTAYSREGGFLDAATEFDAALLRDQSRGGALDGSSAALLLEAAWEALEHAGIDPGRCAAARPASSLG